ATGEEAVLLAELAVAYLDAQGTNGVVDDLGLVGAKENDVAALGLGAFKQCRQRSIVKILHDRRLQSFASLAGLVDLDPCQATGAIDGNELRVGVDLAATDACAAR